MDTSIRSRVSAEASVHINAPRERVWHVLTDFENWPSWNRDVTKIHIKPGAIAPGTVFTWTGGGLRITSTIEAVEPETRITWSGKTIGTRAVHTYELSEEDGGVRVRTHESFAGWLPMLIPGIMQRKLARTLEEGLQQLKAAAESREA